MRSLRLDRLYPITDSGNRHHWNHLQLTQRFLKGGCRFFQIREKVFPDSALYRQLVQIRQVCSATGAQFLVNDRVDLALAVGADGVHLGQDDLPVEVARRLLGPNAILGLSTHNREQFERAQELDLDYVAVGPIFPTTSKTSEHPAVGTKQLAQFTAVSRFPVVAIGGITLDRAPAAWRAGAAAVAVISDVVNASNPVERIRHYLNRN